jgi:hypothetical protein
MPFIIPILGGIIGGAVGGAIGGTVTILGMTMTAAAFGSLVGSIVGMALCFIISSVTQSKKGGASSAQTDAGYLINPQDTQAPLPIIYGEFRVGGSFIYMFSDGASHKNLHVIMTIGVGEIDSVTKFYLDEKEETEFVGYFTKEVFLGTATQAMAANLNAASPEWTDPLRYTAYAYIVLTFASEKFGALPNINALVKGRKVYDPRTGITAWSDNPALCVYDFMTDRRNGIGIDTTFWDEDSVKDCANWCDTRGYKFNGVIYQSEIALDIVQRMLASFRGAIIWGEGKFKLTYFDYDAPCLSLTEDDIKIDSFRVDIPGISELPNCLRVKYSDKVNNYIPGDFLLTDSEAIDIDGEMREHEMPLLGVDNYTQAYQMAVYMLERQRLNYVYSFIAGPKALVLEPLDMITVTHSLVGWVNHLVRIQEIKLLESGEAQIIVRDEAEELYDDTLNLSAKQYYPTTLPDPLLAPPQIYDVQFSEELFNLKDRTYVRLNMEWRIPSTYPFCDHVEVWKSGDGITYDFLANATGSINFEPTNEGEDWYFKFIPVSIWGVKRTLATCSAWLHTVVGDTGYPADVENFHGLVAGDSIHLAWDPVVSDNIAGYEIRYGADWAESIYVASVDATAKTFIGMKPGTHTFLVCAKNTLGRYSENAAWIELEVFAPPGYTSVYDFEDDFTTGTFSNAERYNHPTYGWVLCTIHTLLENGDFEDGVIAPWGFALEESVDIADFAIENSDVYKGDHCGRIDIELNKLSWGDIFMASGGTPWNAVFSPGQPWVDILAVEGVSSTDFARLTNVINGTLEADSAKTYKIRFAAKATTPREMVVAIRKRVYPWTLYGFLESVSLTTNWQLFEFTFSPEVDYTDAMIEFGADGTVGSVYIDCVSIYEALEGYWESIERDLGSNKKLRFWNISTFLADIGTISWEELFDADLIHIWTDKVSIGQTWNDVFISAIAGNVRMVFYWRKDGESTWREAQHFELLSMEVEARYIKYRIYLEDYYTDSHIYIDSPTHLHGYSRPA